MSLMHQPSVQRWLQDHCESSDHVAGGLVILTGTGHGPAQTVAEWPAAGDMTPPLVAAAQASVDRARPVVVAPTLSSPETKHNRVISCPLRWGDRTLGAVALAVRADDSQAVGLLMKDLERSSAKIGGSLGSSSPGSSDSDAARVLQLQDTLLRHATLAEGALALATELAPMLGCDRVALGVVDAGEVDLMALSNSAELKGEQALLRLMVAAMQEAVDQGARVVYPAAPTEVARIVLAHADLHARTGQAVASVALVKGGRVVGALLAEWRGTAPPDEPQLALLDSVACVIGPLVALSHRAERSWKTRTADLLRSGWSRMTRRDDPVPKLLAFALVVALAIATWMPVAYSVGAPARIEGAVQRVVAAPMDGFLHKSHVRPGDTVHAGDLLVELADQDLVLEQRKWEGALAQHENGFAAALARADRAQFVIAQGKAGEARAQLELVRQQLARTRLVAPMDGVVIKGDLSQSLGAPVQRGDALLMLAPADRYRLIVDVDERDIAGVKVGQTGQLALSSLPVDTLGFVVERVTPVATVHDGRNAFEVEARLLAAAPLLRPGLQGVVKIDAGERTAAWIWGHRGVDWLRLALWSWGP
jgi:multidrug efflux pump subunit AcrA (membrane-fusion protein)